jgi:SAM-dependent methyltransferase
MATTDDRQAHWQRVWTTREADRVSWFESRADRSFALIRDVAEPPAAAIIDVGGGASVLVDRLLAEGFRDVTVLDVSAAALGIARARLGASADRVHWIASDVLAADLPERGYDLWHDRAVFHFLTEADDRQRYVHQLTRALRPDGHAVIACFAPEGPEKCSGLPVVRYDAPALAAELGPRFELLRSSRAEHSTPTGAAQQFLYALFRRRAG